MEDSEGFSPMTTEMRRHPRVRIPLLVQYQTLELEESQLDYAENISQSGIFLTMEKPFKVGTNVRLEFLPRGRGMGMVTGEGRVVRVAEGETDLRGAGIEFISIDESGAREIEALVSEGLVKTSVRFAY